MSNTTLRRAWPAGCVLIAAALAPCCLRATDTTPVDVPQTRDAAQDWFRQAYDAHDHAAAVERARIVVEMTQRDPSAQAVRLAMLGVTR